MLFRSGPLHTLREHTPDIGQNSLNNGRQKRLDHKLDLVNHHHLGDTDVFGRVSQPWREQLVRGLGGNDKQLKNNKCEESLSNKDEACSNIHKQDILKVVIETNMCNSLKTVL